MSLAEQAVLHDETPLVPGHDKVSASACPYDRCQAHLHDGRYWFGCVWRRSATRGWPASREYKYKISEDSSHQRPGDDQKPASPLVQGLLVVHVQKLAVSEQDETDFDGPV